MNTAHWMARWGRKASQAYWHGAAMIGVFAGAAWLAMPAWAQDDISKVIGKEGTVRKTVRTGLDFGLWLVTVMGMCLAIAGLWSAYQQIKQQEQQRQWGKPLMMLGFGGLLAGAKKIWEWVAASFTGEAVEDVTSGSRFGNSILDPDILIWLDGLWSGFGALLA